MRLRRIGVDALVGMRWCSRVAADARGADVSARRGGRKNIGVSRKSNILKSKGLAGPGGSKPLRARIDVSRMFEIKEFTVRKVQTFFRIGRRGGEKYFRGFGPRFFDMSSASGYVGKNTFRNSVPYFVIRPR